MELIIAVVLILVIGLVQAGFHLLIMPLLLQIALGALSLGAFSFVQCLAMWFIAMTILRAVTRLIKSFKTNQ